MAPEDDPEARIRDLERPLVDTARGSELGAGGFPPPPPGPPAPWPTLPEPYPGPPPPHRGPGSIDLLVLFGVASMVLVAGGIAVYLLYTNAGAGNSDTFSDTSSTRETTVQSSQVRIPGALAPTQAPAGETIVVSGIGQHQNIDCRDNTVIVSGVENRLDITGHCVALTVSGVDNTIAAESVDTIGVSGFGNRVTYHYGQPQVDKAGQDNTVEPG